GQDWDESQANKKVLRRDGGVLNWFVSTGSLQFQGKTDARRQLEADVLQILYPGLIGGPGDGEIEQDEADASPRPLEAHPVSLEAQYLLHGINNSEIVIGIVSAVGTESKRVTEPLKDRLRGFGYATEEIRVS